MMDGAMQPASLSSLEKEVLNAIQEEFPLARRPFLEVAKRLGREEGEVVETVKSLRQRGVIRRIGASFDSELLGLASTLVAMKVPEERMEEAAAVVNAFPEVTHNYQRDHKYNLWFTIVAGNQARIEAILDEIRRKTGSVEIHSLPALRRFKIRVKFNL